jgi:hypothetical protein
LADRDRFVTGSYKLVGWRAKGILVQVGQNNCGSCFCEGFGRCQAHTGRGAGNKRNLAFE